MLVGRGCPLHLRSSVLPEDGGLHVLAHLRRKRCRHLQTLSVAVALMLCAFLLQRLVDPEVLAPVFQQAVTRVSQLRGDPSRAPA